VHCSVLCQYGYHGANIYPSVDFSFRVFQADRCPCSDSITISTTVFGTFITGLNGPPSSWLSHFFYLFPTVPRHSLLRWRWTRDKRELSDLQRTELACVSIIYLCEYMSFYSSGVCKISCQLSSLEPRLEMVGNHLYSDTRGSY
jgi:hypothetical protein